MTQSHVEYRYTNLTANWVIRFSGSKLVGIQSVSRGKLNLPNLPKNHPVAEFLDGRRRTPGVPIELRGTEFQKRVWTATKEIPSGTVISYGELARRIQKPKAARAVGRALGRNPVMLAVPCHRVVGSNGALTGFGGGIPLKKKLLSAEKK